MENPTGSQPRDESPLAAETKGVQDSGTLPESESQEHGQAPVPRFPVSIAFSVLLVAVYGLSSYANGFDKPTGWAFYWGTFIPQAVTEGQWWRPITGTLMHAYPSHLFNNLFGILAFGSMLEPVLGARRLLALYVLSAVLGLAFSFVMVPGPSLGASTIGYGLIGCYFGLILLLRYRTNRALFWQELRGAVVFVVIFSTWNMMEIARINFWGHLGGFLAGLLFAAWVVSGLRQAALKENRNP